MSFFITCLVSFLAMLYLMIKSRPNEATKLDMNNNPIVASKKTKIN